MTKNMLVGSAGIGLLTLIVPAQAAIRREQFCGAARISSTWKNL